MIPLPSWPSLSAPHAQTDPSDPTQLASTRLITEGSGNSVATYTFDSYGKLTATTGSITNPFRFAGQYLDNESALYYLRARYYDPSTGDFITRDPALASTREPYAYSFDSPTNLTDPTGLCSGFDPGCWAGAVGPQLAQLPGAVLHDIGQGQENFIRNFQNGGYIAVGVPLLAAGGIAAVGVAGTAGLFCPLALRLGASAGAAQARFIVSTAVITAGALAAKGIFDALHEAHNLPGSDVEPLEHMPFEPTPVPAPAPSPLYGPAY